MFRSRIWVSIADYPTSRTLQNRPYYAACRRIYMGGPFSYISRCIKKWAPATQSPQLDFSLKPPPRAPLTPILASASSRRHLPLIHVRSFSGRCRASFEGVAGFQRPRVACVKSKSGARLSQFWDSASLVQIAMDSAAARQTYTRDFAPRCRVARVWAPVGRMFCVGF